jgi:hypothetical protein
MVFLHYRLDAACHIQPWTHPGTASKALQFGYVLLFTAPYSEVCAAVVARQRPALALVGKVLIFM